MSYGPLGNKIFGYDLPNTNTPYTWYIKQGPFLVILGLDFFLLKRAPLGVIFIGESIARIPEA